MLIVPLSSCPSRHVLAFSLPWFAVSSNLFIWQGLCELQTHISKSAPVVAQALQAAVARPDVPLLVYGLAVAAVALVFAQVR